MTTRRARRLWNLLSLLSALALVLTACAGAAAPTATPPAAAKAAATTAPTGATPAPAAAPQSAAKMTISFWTWFQGVHYEENLKYFIKTFQDKYPNVEVKYESLTWEEGGQKVSVQLAAGEPPDVMFAYFNPAWIETGYVMPVDDQLTADEKADFGENSLKAYSYKGKLYGFPIWKQLWNVSANRELLEAAGVDWKSIQKEGWTFEKFNEVAAKLTKETGKLGKKQWGFVYNGTWSNSGLPEMWSLWNMNSGVQWTFDESGKFLFNDPRALENLRRIASYNKDMKVSPPENPALTPAKMGEMFNNWEAAMIARSGPYIVPQQKDRCDKIKAGKEQGTCVEPVMLPFPHLQGEKEGTNASVPAHIVFKGKTDKGADFYKIAVEFARHMSSAEATCKWSADLYEVPARESGIKYCQETKTLDMQDPNMQFFKQYFDRAAVMAKVLPAELQPKALKAQREGIFPSYEAMLLGAKTPEQAYPDIVTTVERILKE
ncbi:MAG TPA: extracellular solute-binding protein [Chloroflexota bacterium]